jgi:hypothetical protein
LLRASAVKLSRPLLLAVMEDLVGRRMRDGAGWIPRSPADLETFATAFSLASRHAGRSALDLDRSDADRLRDAGVTWSLARWAVDDGARAVLLLRAGEVLDLSAQAEIVDRGYHRGDLRQRQAVLRALPLLPHSERFLAVALDAARSGMPGPGHGGHATGGPPDPLFEAIACENPYPAAHFPALNFNQLVVQALATGVALDRVEGLGARVTPDLMRMAKEYAAERRAAGRSVPADLTALTVPTRSAA